MTTRRATGRLSRGALLVVAALVAFLVFRDQLPREAPIAQSSQRESVSPAETAFRDRASGVFMEVEGVVVRQLDDDNDGSRHQRFIVDVGDGHTVLISHNIDLAPRVPVADFDSVGIRGEYEWNERGGVIHWTHHDPEGESAGGWVEHRGRRYR